MKRIIALFVLLTTVLVFAACGEKETDVKNSGGDTTQDAAAASGEAEPSGEDAVDIDLTKLSSSLVYSEVYNMVTEPDSYIGKTVRLKGQFNASYYEPTDNYYYYVIIQDATACCANGIEFIWEGDHSYPSDYPQNGDEIEISGVYGTYDELGITYYYISTDSISLK